MKIIKIEIPKNESITEELSKETMIEIIDKILVFVKDKRGGTKHDLVVAQQGGDLYMKFECIVNDLEMIICNPQMN
jgi:hypothetical protein